MTSTARLGATRLPELTRCLKRHSTMWSSDREWRIGDMAFRRNTQPPIPACDVWRKGALGAEATRSKELGEVGICEWGIVFKSSFRRSWIGVKWAQIEFFGLTDSSGVLVIRFDDGDKTRSPGRFFVPFLDTTATEHVMTLNRMREQRYLGGPKEQVPAPVFETSAFRRWALVLADQGIRQVSISSP
jgi:hypothetical protein